MKMIMVNISKNAFVLFLLLLSHGLWAQQSKPDTASFRILVVGFDTAQFYSNVFYLEDLAYYNNTTTDSVVEKYRNKLMQTLKYYDAEKYDFVIADSADQVLVQRSSNYLNVVNDYDEESIGLAANDTVKEPYILDLMKKYDAGYLLSINAYEIYREKPPNYISYSTKTKHILHYDLFDRNLNSVTNGKIPLTTFANESFFMVGRYEEFAKDLLLRLRAYLTADENESPRTRYKELKESLIKDYWGMGLSVGFGSPYGILGIHATRYLNPNVDINLGLGYDFSGFKFGAGARIYMLNFESKFKPFLAMNYAYATGNEFQMGGATDEFGNQLDPDDVSNLKIYSDHAIHMGAGVRYLFENQQVLLNVGYSFPFKDKNPIIRSGKESQSRLNFAEAMAPGGLDITLTYSFYLVE
ncbi:MAG: hypothetical protein ACOCXH_02710 [Cyclobacteriaceae bacterium]